MTRIEELKIKIAKLETRYQASATRNVYKIGNQLRAAKAELNNLIKK